MGRRFRARGRIPLTIVCSVVCAVLVATVTVPGRAIAKSGAAPTSGVHVDPGSPTFKEYSIPLAAARGDGRGSAGDQLFGAGIRPGGSSGGGSSPIIAGARVSRASSGGPGGHSGSRIAGGGQQRRSSKSIVADQTPLADAIAGRVLGAGQGSGLLWMLAAACVVLLSGLLLAFGLTRRRDFRRARPRMEL